MVSDKATLVVTDVADKMQDHVNHMFTSPVNTQALAMSFILLQPIVNTQTLNLKHIFRKQW